ncbi:TPA: restriction endonuclease [Elizabethkingia anophelis]|uniref:5-methylcytosine restriction system specificity protein McrC n=1 Tax=Elizabethkingia anophelis TaxID=1117645 RepID=UPI00372EBB23
MKISLSEHCKFQVFQSVENPDKNRSYLSDLDFSLVKINNRKKLFTKVFPYHISESTTEKCYNLQANYYVGLDWLVQGKKFLQVEPKINKRLLEIYQTSIQKEIENAEDVKQEDKENETIVQASQNHQENLAQVDYLKMLLDVYASGISAKEIGDLLEIYWEDPKIKIEQKEDHLTPFLIVQFLSLLKVIVRKGLKKSYYKIQENLTNQVKGKILVGQHIKQNVFKNRFTTTYCEYQFFGEDNLENQFLKKTFEFCTSYVENQSQFFNDTKADIENLINYIRPTFQNISDFSKQNQLKHFKYNPFFKEYKDAIRIGNFILKQFSYNISSTTDTKIETPPFWIDMPRLFELYVYQKLLRANPNDSRIKYQFSTHGNYLDFLIKDGQNSIIIDTKYKLHYQHGQIHEDIRQVSGYARLKKVRKECNILDDTHIKCLIIYPTLEVVSESFTLDKIKEHLSEENEIKTYHEVYKLGIKLPVI